MSLKILSLAVIVCHLELNNMVQGRVLEPRLV